MSTCFVMQPFDGGAFDKRYDGVFEPAIEAAGLEPYRVDRDPSVSIPIEQIESGIREAKLCLAEITTDNPNVWFELGFAIAVPKEVVLVCSDERKTRFPFDIQHRSIIKYKTESPQDFAELRDKITARINALEQKVLAIDATSNISPVADDEGLSQHEMVALITVMQNSFISGEGVWPRAIQEDMNKAGFTDIAISLALSSLEKKDMLTASRDTDQNGNPYTNYWVRPDGEDWLMRNQDKLVLRNQPKAKTQEQTVDPDNIPF